MADTRPNIALPANTPVDIYAALNAQSGYPAVTVGTAIRVVNVGANEVFVYSSATAPTVSAASTKGLPVPHYGTATNEAGDAGAWATSVSVDGLINVAVV